MAKTETRPGRVRGEGQAPPPRIRIASTLELSAVNAVIDGAMATWDTTARVKRLAGPVYRYLPGDFDNMWVMVAEDGHGTIVGVAALEEADQDDLPAPGRGLLLHGIFVTPGAMGRGFGRTLVDASTGIARGMGYRGLLVKAVRQSRGFFERCGLIACDPVDDSDYPYRYWRDFPGISCTAAAADAAWRSGFVQLDASGEYADPFMPRVHLSEPERGRDRALHPKSRFQGDQ